MSYKLGKLIPSIAFILAGALSLSACGGTSTSTTSTGPAVPDTITAQSAYSSRDFDPLSTSMALPMSGNWHVTESLYILEQTNGKIVNGLAKGEPQQVSDTEYVVELRDGAKFSDGNAVTSADVKSTIDRMMVEGNVYQPMLAFIESVDVKGDTAVDFKLKEPYSLFKERLTLPQIIPASLDEKAAQKLPIGSGPWAYSKITDQQVTFEPNKYYNGDFPAQAKHMVWNVNVDDTARVTAMQGGKNDVMENVPANAFSTLKSSGSEIITKPGFNQAYVMFNTKQKPFDDKRVRQAVLYAINVDDLIKNQLDGQAKPVTSYLPESNPYYHKASNVYSHDLDKAKKLLAEAGVTGKVKFTLYTTDQTWITSLAPQIKNDLTSLGFDVDVQSMKWSALSTQITDKDGSDFSMMIGPGDPTVFGNDPDILLNWWYGDNIWTHKRTNWYGSDGYNKLHEYMDEAIKATDDSQRQEYWNQALDVLSDEVPLYGLFHRNMSTAVRKGSFKKIDGIATPGLYLLDSKLN